MSENTQTEGVQRTETGEIRDQSQTSTQTSTTTAAGSAPGQTQDSQGEKKAEGDGKTTSLLNDKDGATGAPEKYETFKVPEGFTLDETVSAEASTLFKGMDLTQDEAQQLVDFYVKQTNEVADAPYKLYNDMREEWRGKVKADAEIGHKLPTVKATVSKAIDSLGDPTLAKDFREAMDLTGAGDNPAFIKAFYKLALRLTEGAHVSGTGPSTLGQKAPGAAPKSAASAMYPNLT